MEHFGALPKELVTPLCVFAAGRKEFDVVVCREVSNASALALIFEHIPLGQGGWEVGHASICYLGLSSDKWPLFRVRRVAATHSSSSIAPQPLQQGEDVSLGGKRKQPSPAAAEGTHSAGSM